MMTMCIGYSGFIVISFSSHKELLGFTFEGECARADVPQMFTIETRHIRRRYSVVICMHISEPTTP